ncbi:uncharacterized protein LOC143284346 [Babylonia areolata]|uniref:uncharacterized protein LOC143284346 n=1 Tax=Babylonia areolata TaxID=304850 RepID=UPI003FD1612F
MQTEIDEVRKENKELKEKVSSLEEKLDDQESRGRRKNLIFYGIPTPPNRAETYADCEEAVKDVLRNKMGIQEEIPMERAHRLKGGRGGTRPIIVLFEKYKHKEKVLSECKKLKGTDVFVSEDFTLKVREKRRQLLPFLREAKSANKRAFLRFDSLVVEGKHYVYDAEARGLREKTVNM